MISLVVIFSGAAGAVTGRRAAIKLSHADMILSLLFLKNRFVKITAIYRRLCGRRQVGEVNKKARLAAGLFNVAAGT
jgi:hypothetical protein